LRSVVEILGPTVMAQLRRRKMGTKGTPFSGGIQQEGLQLSDDIIGATVRNRTADILITSFTNAKFREDQEITKYT